MEKGKCAAMAGHGFLGAFLASQFQTPEVAKRYSSDLPGTKICLSADLAGIKRAQAELQEAGIPHYLVVDEGCPNFFGGQPIITALGFGPAIREQAKPITKRFNLL